MKFLVQRVQNASVKVNDKVIGSINKGLLVFVGVTHEDTKLTADYLVNKLINMRIFTDENDKMNLSLKQVKGELLIVSQFTLYADTKKGNRPSFTDAAKPEYADELYNYVIDKCKEEVEIVEHGEFGAKMEVNLINDVPVTIMLEHLNS